MNRLYNLGHIAAVILFFLLTAFGERDVLLATEPELANPIPRDWQLMKTNELSTIERALAASADSWKPAVVPEIEKYSDSVQYLWYRCQFKTSELSATQRAFLCFDGVKFAADVWIKPLSAGNSDFQSVGGYRGGAEPFEIDVTDQTKSGGTFDLLVLVEGLNAISKQSLPTNEKRKPGVRPIESIQDALLWPAGSHGASEIGIWEPVRYVVRDTVQFDDLYIQTSFRNKKIQIDGILKNLTDQPLNVRLEGAIESTEGVLEKESGNVTGTAAGPTTGAAPQLPIQTVELPASGTARFSIVQDWPNPRVWSIRDPHLYNLTINQTINLKASTGAEARSLPAMSQRFGFREFWAEGDLFYLNGVPMHALATAKHPGNVIQGNLSRAAALDMYQSIRRVNCNFMRLHANLWPKHWTEVADETGMPLILETGFFCWQRSYALTDPQFWTNFDVHVRSLQKKFRNNPSFCCLSLENEILHCGALYRYPDCEKKLAEAGVKAKQFDATRPISFDGDMDPKTSPESEGVADVVNPHYPMDFCGTFTGNEDTNWPDDAWWIDRGKVMACYPREFWKWDRKKPLYFGEFLHIQHAPIVDAFSLVLGDQTYEASHDLTMARAKAKAWSMQIPAYRAAGVTGMCPWTLTEPGVAPMINGQQNPRYEAVRDAYEPVIAVMKPTNYYFYDGDKKTLEFWLINDTDVERDLELTVDTGAALDTYLAASDELPEQKKGNALKAHFGSRDNDQPDTTQKLPIVRLKPAQRKQVFLDLDTSKMQPVEIDDDFFNEGSKYEVRVTLRHKAVENSATGAAVDWTKTGRVLTDGTDAYFQKQGASQYLFSLRKGYRNQPSGLNESGIAALGSRIGIVGEIGPAMERLVANGAPMGKTTVLRFVPEADSIPKALEANVDFLIIGKNALTAVVPQKTVLSVRGFGSFREQLGRFKKALVLEQDEYPAGVFPVDLAQLTISSPGNNQYTKVFSCRKPFLIPDQGGWDYSCRLGGPKGYVYAPLLKSGNLVLSQFPIVDQGDVNPYVFDQLTCSLHAPCDFDYRLYVFDSTGAIQKALKRIGARYHDVLLESKASGTQEPDGKRSSAEITRIVLVNADSEGEYAPEEKERTIFCGLTPKNLSKWSAALPAGLTLSPADAAIELNPSFPSILMDRTDEFKAVLFQGPAADLYWYGQREPGLSSRVRTPRQNVADWAVVPFTANEDKAKDLPLISYQKFKANHEKAQVQGDCLFSSVAVELTTTLEAVPDCELSHFFLEIDGHGRELFGENSRLKVFIDGNLQGLVELEDKFSTKRCPVTIEQFPCELKLVYCNDLWDPETKIDRNLWFRSVRLIPGQPLPDFASTTRPAVSAFVQSRSSESYHAYGTIVDNVKWYRPDFSTPNALRYITDWLRDTLHTPFESPLSGLTISGSAFELKTSLGGKDKYQTGTAHLGTNGSLAQQVDFGESGRYEFTLRADGTPVEDVYPHVNLRIDGKIVGEFQLTQRDRADYSLEADVEKGVHTVQLQFDNDKYIPSNDPNVPNQDRNLNVESLKIR